VTRPRRLSQAISEGDGISLIVAVDGPRAAREAEERGAEAVLVSRGDGIEEIRAAVNVPIVRFLGEERESGGEDACIVGAREGDVVISGDVELVVLVVHEDELDETLERFDPELVVLASGDAEEPLQHVLDLLADVPAGKLVIADTGGAATQAELDELERAGIDAVLVRDPR
jgi:hypothetical protein